MSAVSACENQLNCHFISNKARMHAVRYAYYENFFLFETIAIVSMQRIPFVHFTISDTFRLKWAGGKTFVHPMPCAKVAMTINNGPKCIYDIRVFPFLFVNWSQ